MLTAAVRTCYLVAGIIGLWLRSRRRQPIAVAVLIGALLRTAGAADNLEALLTAEEGAEVDTVFAQAISLGFPEVRGGEWHTRLSFPHGPFNLHLAGDTWLVDGYRLEHKQEQETPTIDAAALAGALETTPPEDLPWEILRVPAVQRARLQRAATISYSGFCSAPFLGERSEPVPNISLPGAILRRCAQPGLGDRLLLQAQYQRTRAEYGLCFGPTAVEHFGIGALPARRWDEHSRTLLLLKDEEIEQWTLAVQSRSEQAPPALTLIPVATALRRECHWWFRERLLEAKPADAPALAAAALAMLSEDDRARASDDIARLLARAGISEHPAPGATLADRLAAWDLGPFSTREPWMFDEWDSVTPLTPAAYREQFPAPAPGVEPTRDQRLYDQKEVLRSCTGEIAGLVDLLGSSAPCRWLESDTPRTLGDNALRALTLLWSVDPRVLIGRDRFAVWTAEERAATATELQRFWRAQHEQGIDPAIRAHLASVPAWCLARSYQNAAPDQRTLLVASMVAAWKGGPPAPRGRQEEVDGDVLLASLAKDAAFAPTVRGWSIQGPMARAIMLAHELAGDGAPLDDLLTRVATGRDTPADRALTGKNPYECEFAIALHHPSAARVRMLAGIFTAYPVPPAWEAALIGLFFNPSAMVSRSHLEAVLLDGPLTIDARAVLLDVVLGDQRPVPQVVRDGVRWGYAGSGRRAGEQADLRICDLAMRLLANADHWDADAKRSGAQDLDAAFDLSMPRATRDAVIAARREVMHVRAESAMSQLKLTAADYQNLRVKEATSDF